MVTNLIYYSGHSLENMTHVIHIIEVIGDYSLPLTSSMKVGNNDTCK